MKARIEKEILQLIMKSLIAKEPEIKESSVKAGFSSKMIIKFSELTKLEDHQIITFVKSCLVACGTNTQLMNFQVKIPGSESEFQGIDIILNFDNQEQKQKYLEYRNQLLA